MDWLKDLKDEAVSETAKINSLKRSKPDRGADMLVSLTGDTLFRYLDEIDDATYQNMDDKYE